MKNLIGILALGCTTLLAATVADAAPHNTSFTGGILTEDGNGGATLFLNESNQQASLELVGFPYWPGESDYIFYLPTVTLNGSYTYDSAQEKIFFEVQWDGDALALNDSNLHMRQARCRTSSQGLTFNPNTNSVSGPVDMAGKFHYDGYGDIDESYSSGQTLQLDAPDPTPIPTPTPVPASSDSNFVFSHLDGSQWEQSVGYPALFDAPIFSDDDLGLGLYVNDPTRTFGYWQTINQLYPLPAGRYSLKIFISPDPSSISGRYPEMRIRVFQGDNSLSKMAVFAQVSTDTAVPPYIEVVWNSDGVSPWRVAIDMLSFVPDYDGGYLITNITNDEI
jgi:hypothetical protein